MDSIPYGYLAECGETRFIGEAVSGDYMLEVNVLRPEAVACTAETFDGIPEDIPPFYFSLFKRDEEEKDEAWTYLEHGIPIKNVEDFKKKIKKYGKKNGIPSVTYNHLKSDFELNVLGLGNDFEIANSYFLKTKVERNEQQFVDGLYEYARKRLGPNASYQEMNKYILKTIATERMLPKEVLPQMDVYSTSNRKLTMADIRDDMDTRRLMLISSPFGSDVDTIDCIIQQGKEAMPWLSR